MQLCEKKIFTNGIKIKLLNCVNINLFMFLYDLKEFLNMNIKN